MSPLGGDDLLDPGGWINKEINQGGEDPGEVGGRPGAGGFPRRLRRQALWLLDFGLEPVDRPRSSVADVPVAEVRPH